MLILFVYFFYLSRLVLSYASFFLCPYSFFIVLYGCFNFLLCFYLFIYPDALFCGRFVIAEVVIDVLLILFCFCCRFLLVLLKNHVVSCKEKPRMHGILSHSEK